MAEPKNVVLEWRHDLVFEGGAAGKPTLVLDGAAAEGPSPMEALLLALAGCSGADVVAILKKTVADPAVAAADSAQVQGLVAEMQALSKKITAALGAP